MGGKIFISHIAEEAGLAHALKDRLESDFLGLIDAFVSSDTDSISAGSNWLASIENALKTSKMLLVLCSRESVGRPWVNFEAGLAWSRKIPIVPLCHSGLQLRELPMPLSLLQAALATDKDGVKRVYKLVAKTIGCKVPKSGVADFVAAVKSFQSDQRAAPQTGSPALQAAAATRMRALLADPRFKSRSISQLAVAAGISEADAISILNADPEVIFAKGKTGTRLARLVSR